MKSLTEKEAKKKVCPYDGSKCGVSICMAWVQIERKKESNDQLGYCARIRNAT